MAHHLPAKALLEAIDPPQAVAGQHLQIHRQIFHRRARAAAPRQPHRQPTDLIGDAPKVIARCAAAPRPLHSRPLQRVVGHARPFLAAARAPHIPGHLPHRHHHQRAQRLAVGLGQQKFAPLRREQVIRRRVIVRAVQRKAIARARLGHKCGKRGQVGAGHRPHSHPLARGQTHVIAPLAFHARQHRVLVTADVQHNRTRWLHRLAAGPEAQIAQRGLTGQAVGPLRLHPQQGRACLASGLGQRVHHRAGRRGIPPIHHRPARHISNGQPIGATQEERRPSQRRAGHADCADHHARSVPAKARLERSPRRGLQKVGMRLPRQPRVPGSILQPNWLRAILRGHLADCRHRSAIIP